MTETEQEPRRRRKRKKINSRKKLRLFLLSLGITGLMLGIALCGGRVFMGNPKLGRLGILYLLASALFLGAHRVVYRLDKFRKRGYSKW